MAQNDEKMNGLDDVNTEFKKIELELKKQELAVQIEHEKNKKRIIFCICILVAFLTVITVVNTNIQSNKEAKELALNKEEQFQNQMQSLYDEGMMYLQADKYSKAIDTFSQIVSEAVCYNDAKRQIELCKEEYLQSILDATDIELKDFKYAKALNVVHQGMAYFTDSKELLDKEQKILNLYVENIKSTAAAYSEEGNYTAATSALNEYLQIDINNADIVELKNEYGKLADIQKAKSMKDEGRYVEAISFLKNSSFSKNEELKALYAEVTTLYRNSMLENVNEIIASEGYGAAIRQLNQAISVMGYDDEINQKIVSLEAEKIKNEGFTGRISSEKQVDTYEFTASVAGKYRLEIEDDNAKASYNIKITDATGAELKNRSFSSSNGVTVDFKANKKYTIELKQSSGYASYALKINMPNAVKTIAAVEKEVSGSITFKDQIDSFVYIPDVGGVYRFDIEDDVAGTQYRFFLCDSRGAELRNSLISQGSGKTVELDAGETYTIELRQNSGYANYTLKIGVPKPISAISGNSFSGSITYTDQKDNFTYVAPSTGEYIFKLVDDNSGTHYRYKIVNERGAELRNSIISSGDQKKVDLTAGSTYTISIIQNSGFANYSVSITN